MSTYDYRILKDRDGIFSVREVCYDPDGTIAGWSDEPVSPCGETEDEFKKNLDLYNQARNCPVLDEVELQAKQKDDPEPLRCADHTPCPDGYLDWHAWAEEKAKTHRSKRCSECRLFKIWVPK